MKEWKTQVEQPAPAPLARECPTLDESIHFSPRHRPIYPRLVILDDGEDSGEVFRLRSQTITIGRSGCDLSFPAEGLMSGSHAKIVYHELTPGHWSWVLEDQSSRNGIFVRQQEFLLLPGCEFLIGGTKMFVHGDLPIPKALGIATPLVVPLLADKRQVKRSWELELRPYMFSQEPLTIPFQGREFFLGRHAEGADALSTDLFVEPEHALVQKIGPSTWKLVDQNSLNGIWLRVLRAVLSQTTSFIVGEQRFRFEVPE